MKAATNNLVFTALKQYCYSIFRGVPVTVTQLLSFIVVFRYPSGYNLEKGVFNPQWKILV